MEHTITLTCAQLQEQLDSMSALCRRLTDALHTMAEERDAANKALQVAMDIVGSYSEDKK